jgi:cyclic pyranopterin phosphate synthase
MKPVSPYLQRPLRGMHEACFEIARARGEPAPRCHGCMFEDRCLAEARCLRRDQKKLMFERMRRTASGVTVESDLGGSLPANSRYIQGQRCPGEPGAGVDSAKVEMALEAASPLIDPFARAITYLRVSVTDRCDFRCVYCMAEDMTFLPKTDVLTLEELDRLCGAFVARGVRKLRLTGGEPLVRRNIMWLIRRLGRHLESGALDELTLTTNGSQLGRYAAELVDAGVKRINVSLDTLDAQKFKDITLWGRFEQVMEGIRAAADAGLAIKINTVALKGVNDDEFAALVAWCGAAGHDLTFIEVMPMGEIGANARLDQYMPLSMVRAKLMEDYTLDEIDYRTGGPARYYRVAETGGRVGFITPMTHNFCESCNRVRLTCTGTLYMCLGQEDAADLRAPLRASEADGALMDAIDEAIGRKPKGHDFILDRRRADPSVSRHMSVTGG